jgi:hypothetical protein
MRAQAARNWYFFTHPSAPYILPARNLALNSLNPRLRLGITSISYDDLLHSALYYLHRPLSMAGDGRRSSRWHLTQIGSVTIISSMCAKVPGFSTDIYDFLISWQVEHLVRRVGCSRLLPVLATWECCVSLCENSGKRLRFSNQLEKVPFETGTGTVSDAPFIQYQALYRIFLHKHYCTVL